MFGANHVHVLLIILTDLQIWGFGLTAIYYATPWQAWLLRIFGLMAIYYATPWQARLLRIFGLTAIYTVHASAMQACLMLSHLHCSRLLRIFAPSNQWQAPGCPTFRKYGLYN